MTRNLIVVSDLHCGCRLGLCPDAPQRLDGGTYHLPSAFQKQLWGLWREFWDVWVPEATKGEPFDLVVNGDALDGTHHNSTTQISHNIEDQRRIAEAALGPEVARCLANGGTYYHIRGTEAHVGSSGEYEETLARTLGAKPNAEGQHARFDLWHRVGGALVHCLHHIGTTGSAAHEASAVNAEYTAMLVEAARWGHEPPDYVVRSHRHRSIAVDMDTAKGYGASIVTPCWQGLTPFTYRVPGARVSQPQFGGILIRDGDEEHYYRRKVWSIGRSAED